jgi:mono/diheme cytochrome c family protein
MPRRYVSGLLIVAAALFIFWARLSAAQQAQPAPAQAPAAHSTKPTPADAARPNPMKFTENSVKRGKHVYETQCSMCHGDAGVGDGDVAKDMNAKPPDFTNAATLKSLTDGELFAIIGSGSGVMPGQGERMKDYHKWDVINYLRSLSGQIPAKSTPDEYDPDHPTVVLQPSK